MHGFKLIEDLSTEQIKQMEFDFLRLFPGGKACSTGSKIPCDVVSDLESYRIVVRVLSMAHLAAQKGEHERFHFLKGMAAAIHGLIRLAEAQELEKELAGALGIAVPLSENRKSAETPAKEEVHMSHSPTHFTFEDMVGFFAADGIRFMSDKKRGSIVTVWDGGKHGRVCLMAQVDERCKAMILSFELPLTVPPQRRSEFAEALTRANYGLVIGHFEMDMETGELNYRVTVPIDDAMLSHAQFCHCVGAAMGTVHQYTPAFLQVAFHEVSAEEAIKACEA